MTVWVVMSNDFPDCVFANKTAAQAYCKAKNDADREEHRPHRRIYYKWYEFGVTR